MDLPSPDNPENQIVIIDSLETFMKLMNGIQLQVGFTQTLSIIYLYISEKQILVRIIYKFITRGK